MRAGRIRGTNMTIIQTGTDPTNRVIFATMLFFIILWIIAYYYLFKYKRDIFQGRDMYACSAKCRYEWMRCQWRKKGGIGARWPGAHRSAKVKGEGRAPVDSALISLGVHQKGRLLFSRKIMRCRILSFPQQRASSCTESPEEHQTVPSRRWRWCPDREWCLS